MDAIALLIGIGLVVLAALAAGLGADSRTDDSDRRGWWPAAQRDGDDAAFPTHHH